MRFEGSVYIFIQLIVRIGQGGSLFLALKRIAAHEKECLDCQPQSGRLSHVIAILPLWVKPNSINDHSPPNTVSNRDLGWQTGKRHKRIHEVWIHFAPKPGVHTAH